jgi:hypothetical protein
MRSTPAFDIPPSFNLSRQAQLLSIEEFHYPFIYMKP